MKKINSKEEELLQSDRMKELKGCHGVINDRCIECAGKCCVENPTGPPIQLLMTWFCIFNSFRCCDNLFQSLLTL